MIVPYAFLANATAGPTIMRDFVTPAVTTLCVLATLACTFFLVLGGIQYMSSSGHPEKLDRGKRLLKNALLGLVLVLGAATLTAVLSHAYVASGTGGTEKFPQLAQLPSSQDNFQKAILDAINGFLRTIAIAAGEPLVKALQFFTTGTPLMAANANIFNLWLTVVGITDVLFVLVVALLGFQVMSSTALGLDEVDIKQLLPQLAVMFLLINISIFAIDAVISLSNAMINALRAGFPTLSIWNSLVTLTQNASDIGLVASLFLLAFLVLTVMLLVYYVLRLVTLYAGAVLAPVVLVLWLIPAFKDFVIAAIKTYLVTIFVLFVHVVLLLIAGAMFEGMLENGGADSSTNVLMALLVGMGTLVALLKTQSVMRDLSYAASAPRAARELGGQFIKGVNSLHRNGHKVADVRGQIMDRVRAGRNHKDKGPLPGKGGGDWTGSSPFDTPPPRTGETVMAKQGETA
jgi:hypothetical protein